MVAGISRVRTHWGDPSTVGLALADVPRSGNLPQDQSRSHRATGWCVYSAQGKGRASQRVFAGPMRLMKPAPSIERRFTLGVVLDGLMAGRDGAVLLAACGVLGGHIVCDNKL